MIKGLNKKNYTLRIIALCYMFLILLGAIILMLPASSKTGKSIPFLDALFTATSATCVTGLSVFDIFSQFNILGQLTILTLIQIGGIGFMTVASIFLMMTGKRIGLWSRDALSETINAFHIGGIIRLAKLAVIATLLFEIIGAMLLAIRFCPILGFGTGIYYAIFHAISAFCNAGFDLMGIISPNSSLTAFSGDIIVNITVMLLIIIGGLGFIVWDDIYEHKFRFRKFRLHTKIVLITSILLILFGAIAFFLLEYSFNMANYSTTQKILISTFQSTTTRTAGFSSIDISELSGGSVFLTIILMIIGASPGSTGGGIKTTTFIIILVSAISYLKNNNDVNVLNRRLEKDALKKALSAFFVYIVFATTAIFTILLSQELELSKVVFEVVSAISTVGLSTGITKELNTLSKIIIMILMLCGRMGSLTFASIFTGKNTKKINIRLPEEKVIIG